jgi:hypothetical protein
MAWGGRVFQVLPINFPPVFSLIGWFLWYTILFGKLDMKAAVTLKPWHHALGFVHKNGKPNPANLIVCCVFILSCKLEVGLWHVLDLLLLIAYNLFTLRWTPGSWPAWSTYGDEVYWNVTCPTGLGDLLTTAAFCCESAKHLGIRTLVLDGRNSSYCTDKEVSRAHRTAARDDLPTHAATPSARPRIYMVMVHAVCSPARNAPPSYDELCSRRAHTMWTTGRVHAHAQAELITYNRTWHPCTAPHTGGALRSVV